MIKEEDPRFHEDFVKEVLFFGGTWDRQWKHVDLRMEVIRVARPPKPITLDLAASSESSTVSMEMEIDEYRRMAYMNPYRRYAFHQYEIIED